ncbi:YlbF family regulator [Secundilactobacillus oryzae]|uniref:YlbF family regulator n=1 Tax=Secundilactobacillus oryzae TaxID=1202668 RepID=UPI000ABE2E46|nr:YlbF family regulator [Secundilactobacillus oryzae]
MTLQKKQMQGEELAEDEIKKAHDIAEKVGQFDEIKALMDHEKKVNDLLQQLNQVITQPIQELYRN